MLDLIDELMKRNQDSPNTLSFLAKYKAQQQAALKDAREHEEEIREVLNLAPDYDLTDELKLLEAHEAMHKQQEYDAACPACQYTVENCSECEFNDLAFHIKYELVKKHPCEKYEVYTAQKRISRLLNESGMGARFNTRTFETFQQTAGTATAKKQAEAFCEAVKADEHATGLLLVGPYGCGKTHLAAAILHRCAEKGLAGMFVVVPELLAKIRTSYRTGDGKAEEIINAAKNTKLLILDDLGAEKASEWVKEQLYMLINYRYEHMLPVVITTNDSGAELEEELGRRTLSRLVEMTKPVKIQAGDYRMRLAASR
jgi:DNA replication protein DnaC